MLHVFTFRFFSLILNKKGALWFVSLACRCRNPWAQKVIWATSSTVQGRMTPDMCKGFAQSQMCFWRESELVRFCQERHFFTFFLPCKGNGTPLFCFEYRLVYGYRHNNSFLMSWQGTPYISWEGIFFEAAAAPRFCNIFGTYNVSPPISFCRDNTQLWVSRTSRATTEAPYDKPHVYLLFPFQAQYSGPRSLVLFSILRQSAQVKFSGSTRGASLPSCVFLCCLINSALSLFTSVAPINKFHRFERNVSAGMRSLDAIWLRLPLLSCILL